jgi:hypothetical protein
MSVRLRVRSLVIAIAILAAACGGRAALESGDSPTVLEVVNRATLDMNIYAVTDAGARERLGTAGSLQTTRLTIPNRLVAPALNLRFQADPVGSTRTHFSDRVPVIPGDIVVLEIPPA